MLLGNTESRETIHFNSSVNFSKIRGRVEFVCTMQIIIKDIYDYGGKSP